MKLDFVFFGGEVGADASLESAAVVLGIVGRSLPFPFSGAFFEVVGGTGFVGVGPIPVVAESMAVAVVASVPAEAIRVFGRAFVIVVPVPTPAPVVIPPSPTCAKSFSFPFELPADVVLDTAIDSCPGVARSEQAES
jgi:hypothetical protein